MRGRSVTQRHIALEGAVLGLERNATAARKHSGQVDQNRGNWLRSAIIQQPGIRCTIAHFANWLFVIRVECSGIWEAQEGPRHRLPICRTRLPGYTITLPLVSALVPSCLLLLPLIAGWISCCVASRWNAFLYGMLFTFKPNG